MRNYILDSGILSKKTTDAYSMLYYMIPILRNIEETGNDAFEEINAHNELGNEDYTSIKSNMEHIQEYMDKYKVFGAVTNGAGQNSSCGYNYNMNTMYQSSTVGYNSNDGFIGEYQREVDDIFYNAQVKTIQKLRDSKLQDIRVENNVGIQGEAPSSLFTMQAKISSGIDKDKIGLEDLLGFGRISIAMHKEYEDMKVEIDAYNASLSEHSSENTSNFISKFIFDAEINKKKIDSYDKYINEMITSSDFDYETNDERTLSIGGYFIPIFGEYKMLAEIVDGKDLVSGRRYSVGEQLFAIGAVGAGSLIGKIYKGVKAGLASGVEETSGKIAEGTVFAMNGARDSSGIEKLAKSITEKVVGKEGGIKGAADADKLTSIINRVKEIRSELPSKLKKSGNFGYSEVEVDGIQQGEFFAHSSVDTAADKGALPGMSFKSEGEPIYKAKKVDPDNARIDTPEAYLRDYDTEYKMLNDIAEKLKNNENATGTINLFTERYTCASCSDIILKFRHDYPNIKLNVLTNDGKVVK